MKTTLEILQAAKAASPALMTLSSAVKNAALFKMADNLEAHTKEILTANAQDVEKAKSTLSEVMIDRLRLDEKRIKAMADGIRDVAKLPDPVGVTLEEYVDRFLEVFYNEPHMLQPILSHQ